MACEYCRQKYFMLECKNNNDTHLEWYCGACFPNIQCCNRCYKNETKCNKCNNDKMVKCQECYLYNYCEECSRVCIYCEKYE